MNEFPVVEKERFSLGSLPHAEFHKFKFPRFDNKFLSFGFSPKYILTRVIVISVGGILSSNPEENPFWWNAHHVFVPYCTSDSWSGTRTRASGGSRFSFMGAAVVRQVVLDLLPAGLANATSLLLAGSSAGGTGVILNLNSIKSLLHDELHLRHVSVRGVSDSGWFLDREPYSKDPHSLTPVDAVRRGIALWQGKVPPLCAASYPSEPWRCYFGYRIYPFLTGEEIL